MKRYVLTVICVAMSFLCAAQNGRIVKGAVLDEDGLPVPGAIVEAEGSDFQTTTAPNGTFSMEVSYMVRTLKVSKEPYVSQKMEIDGSYMAFKLKIDKKYLENKAKAEEAARVAAYEQAKREEAAKKAEEQARIEAAKKAEETAKRAEEARLKAEENARKEAIAKAKAEEVARRQAEEQAIRDAIAKAKAEEAARLAAIKKAKQDSIAVVKAELKEKRIAVNKAYNAKYYNKGLIHNVELNYTLEFAGESRVVYENYGYRSYASQHPIELTYAAGYRFCNWVSLSAGTGVYYEMLNLKNSNDRFSSRYYDEDIVDIVNYTNILVPVFVNSKFYLSRGRHQPLISATFGSYLMPGNSVGYMDVGFGYNLRMSKRGNMYLMASAATIPSLCAYADYWTYHAERSAEFALRFKIGFTF